MRELHYNICESYIAISSLNVFDVSFRRIAFVNEKIISIFSQFHIRRALCWQVINDKL